MSANSSSRGSRSVLYYRIASSTVCPVSGWAVLQQRALHRLLESALGDVHLHGLSVPWFSRARYPSYIKSRCRRLPVSSRAIPISVRRLIAEDAAGKESRVVRLNLGQGKDRPRLEGIVDSDGRPGAASPASIRILSSPSTAARLDGGHRVGCFNEAAANPPRKPKAAANWTPLFTSLQ